MDDTFTGSAETRQASLDSGKLQYTAERLQPVKGVESVWTDKSAWTALECLPAAKAELEEMLPDRWAAAHPEAVLTYRLEESRRKATAQRDRRSRRRTLANARRR